MSFISDYKQKMLEFERAGAEKIEIGKTVLGYPIYAFAVGCGRPKIIVQYAIHAREYITYYLACEQLMDTARLLPHGCGTVYFIPAVNIDGISLVLDGLGVIPQSYHTLLNSICPSGDFGLFKANVRGVDLNVNFDARWGTGSQNVFTPDSANFVGFAPNSEPETQALTSFTRKICPDLTISYHSKGEVIYYDFHQPLSMRKKHKKIAKIASKSTTYPIKLTGNSAGGYKDWCISTLHIPALTIEVGSENLAHPITLQNLPDIYQKNANLIINLLDYLGVILYNKDNSSLLGSKKWSNGRNLCK